MNGNLQSTVAHRNHLYNQPPSFLSWNRSFSLVCSVQSQSDNILPVSRDADRVYWTTVMFLITNVTATLVSSSSSSSVQWQQQQRLIPCIRLVTHCRRVIALSPACISLRVRRIPDVLNYSWTSSSFSLIGWRRRWRTGGDGNKAERRRAEHVAVMMTND